MELNRREMLAACAAIPFGTYTASQPGGDQREWFQPYKVVRYISYEGPGKKNSINPKWAEFIFTECEYEEYCIQCNGEVTKRIDRQIVDGCFLPESQPEWFTAGAETSLDHWKEQYLWYGDVRLVKDVWHLTDGRVKVDYYLCRGDNAIILRKANPKEHAC